MRIWFGRAWMAVAAGLAVLVLTAGVVTAVAVDDGRSSSEAWRVAAEVSVSQLSAATAAGEPSSDAAGSPGQPEAPTEPAPAGGRGASSGPYLGNRTPGAVVTSFEPGRTEWSGVSNGITLRLTMSPAAPAAGETVTFVAEASLPGARCCNFLMQFGDETEGQYPPPPGFDGDRSCSAREPEGSSVRGELRHAYNRGGRWTFRLGARAGGLCGPGEVVYGSLEGVIQIGAGSSSPQGPSLPTVRPASIHPYEPRVITLSAEAQDDDGYIARLIVDWGDGSPQATYTNPRPCQTTAGGWPAGTYTILPLWMGVGTITHRYPDDGPYRVTVTAVSSACDGSGEQRGSGSLTFPEPPPAPPPMESVPWPSPSPWVPPPPTGGTSTNPMPLPPSIPFPTTTAP
jgi:hypothetical protein